MSITVHRRIDPIATPPYWVRENRRPSCSCIAASTQLPLPTFGRSAQPRGPQFAHPAEADFARLLTWHRVRWVYEPTAFAIDWDDSGAPNRYFRPDFYLPDLRMYVELTMMRQPLVTRKNRKLRLVRELYPSIRIKLLYRRDMERLRSAYELQGAASTRSMGEVVFDGDEIRQRVRLMAEQIADEWLGAARGELPPVVLAGNCGAVRFAGEILDELARVGVHAELDRLKRNRFRHDGASRQVRIQRSEPEPLAGRRVLLVEDAVSSGLGANAAADWVVRQGAAEWRVACLLDRRQARLLDLPIDWSAFDAPDQPLAGHGLMLHRQFSDLPAITTVTG